MAKFIFHDEKEKMFSDLKIGDWFKTCDGIYIKIDDRDFDNTIAEDNAINISDCYTERFEFNDRVEPIDEDKITVVIDS